MKHLIKLRKYLKPYLWQLILNMTVLLLITGLSLIIPKIIKDVIDNGLVAGSGKLLINSALIILCIGIGIAGLNLVQRYLTEWIGAHVGYDLRNKMYERIQDLPFTYHDHATTGQLINRCIEDVRAVQSFAGGGIIDSVQLAVLSLGVIYVLFSSEPILASIVLLPMIPMIMITTDFGKRITTLFYAVDNTLGDLSARLQENVTGVQVVRAFAREPYEIERFDRINRDYFKARIKVISEWSKVLPTSHLLITMGTILILLFGGPMVIQGKLTVGELVAFNAYVLMLSAPVQQLTWLVNAVGESEAGAQRVLEILDHVPEIQSPSNAHYLEKINGHITFLNVRLRYQDEKVDALSNINLDVYPNQLVALIGQTGSGKTSLVNLIPRFYDATEGRVLVDGVDVRNVDLVSLRRRIGIVLQTSLLFSDTVMENIRYGKPDASNDEVVAAAMAAQAHDFIMKFEKGYDSLVGERGVTVSGGQRQRIAIARALLMDPRILILDDSTSSVDAQTESLIQESLDQLMVGRTTFVIAHRLSTVRRADVIVVMANGQIVEMGRHEELLSKRGLYKKIADLQMNQDVRFIADGEDDDEFFVQSRKDDDIKGSRPAERGLA